jgi:hypothetical protein
MMLAPRIYMQEAGFVPRLFSWWLIVGIFHFQSPDLVFDVWLPGEISKSHGRDITVSSDNHFHVRGCRLPSNPWKKKQLHCSQFGVLREAFC